MSNTPIPTQVRLIIPASIKLCAPPPVPNCVWSPSHHSCLCELCVDYIRVLMPVINADPHLQYCQQVSPVISSFNSRMQHTFLNVLKPAKILPPIQVEYFLSGGAKIFIRMSLTANRCTSVKRRSPKPLVSVLPPDSTMFAYSAFRRSRSVLLMESTTI